MKTILFTSRRMVVSRETLCATTLFWKRSREASALPNQLHTILLHVYMYSILGFHSGLKQGV